MFETEADADTFVHAVARDWRSAQLATPDRALCEFAARLTHQQQEMSPNDLQRLRDHGFTDVAIHDATQVIAYFNYITRIADALGVPVEEFVESWGEG